MKPVPVRPLLQALRDNNENPVTRIGMFWHTAHKARVLRDIEEAVKREILQE